MGTQRVLIGPLVRMQQCFLQEADSTKGELQKTEGLGIDRVGLRSRQKCGKFACLRTQILRSGRTGLEVGHHLRTWPEDTCGSGFNRFGLDPERTSSSIKN